MQIEGGKPTTVSSTNKVIDVSSVDGSPRKNNDENMEVNSARSAGKMSRNSHRS